MEIIDLNSHNQLVDLQVRKEFILTISLIKIIGSFAIDHQNVIHAIAEIKIFSGQLFFNR